MIKSCLPSKVVNHDSRFNSAKLFQNSVQSNKQTAALQNTSFCTHYRITYESCFTGKVNTYSCESTMKQYGHGLFTTEVENCTSNCTQLYFVESIRKNFMLTDGIAAVVMEDFIHFLQAAVVFKRSVFWTLS